MHGRHGNVQRCRFHEARCLGVLLDKLTACLSVPGWEGRLSGNEQRSTRFHPTTTVDMRRRGREVMETGREEGRHLDEKRRPRTGSRRKELHGPILSASLALREPN